MTTGTQSKPDIVRLYHGTAHAFDAFSEEYIGVGGDANSALGVHLIESPSIAADYADISGTGDKGANGPRVLVVEVAVSKVLCTSSLDDFFGFVDGAHFKQKADFVEVRARLRANGYDAVTIDVGDDTTGTWVILDPSLIKVVGSLSVEEAYEAPDASLPAKLKFASEPLFPTLYEDFEAAGLACAP